MMEKNLNSPLTSSAGRLFDAVSSLLCIRHKISHESQGAMELEAVAGNSREKDVLAGETYEFTLCHTGNDNKEAALEMAQPL